MTNAAVKYDFFERMRMNELYLAFSVIFKYRNIEYKI